MLYNKHFSLYRFFCILSLIAIAFSFITFVGCGEDDDEDKDGNGDNGNADVKSAGSLSAKIAGEDWKADITVVTFEGKVLSVTGQAFPEGIESGNSEQIGFVIQNVNAAGTYQLGLLSGNSGRVALAKAGNGITIIVYVAETVTNAGEVVVTAIDDNGVQGTFHFKALSPQGGETVEVTNGTFDVKFQ